LPSFLTLFQAVTELGNIEFSRFIFVFWKAYMPFLLPLCSIETCRFGIDIYANKQEKNFSCLLEYGIKSNLS
ncbi:MAG: hypothetical protein IJP31_10760, partial [Lachnospiraceae bacterium]|nr:hypothetical protein [Lachnospiraceae bacterium]